MKKNQLKALLLLPAVFSFAFITAQNHQEKIAQYFKTDAKESKIPTQLKEFQIVNVDPSTSLKGDVVQVQQEINGIPVFNKTATFLIKDDKINYVTSKFSSTISINNIAQSKASINEESAFRAFATSIKLKDQNSYQFSNKTISKSLLKTSPLEDIRSQLVYFQKDNSAKLAYKITFREKGTDNYWLSIVDANTSEVLFKANMTVNDRFHGNESFLKQDYSDVNAKKTVAYPLNQTKTNLLKAGAGKYNIYALPVEAPTFGGRSIVNEPFEADVSPLGWNDNANPDFDFLKGYTFGNNATAYTDIENNNNPTDLNQFAYGGPEKNFDFPLDITKSVDTYKDAALTNLFYINNMMHDVSYKFGFTETARNFQFTNFDKGGEGADFVHAEARDGGGMDNANFLSLPDGQSGIMQMYLWDPVYYNGITVNNQPDLSNFNTNTRFPVNITTWPAGGITGDLVIPQPENGCTALTNAADVQGKIALIKRGGCLFTDKTLNAYNAGAKAILFYNEKPSDELVAYAPTYYAEIVYNALVNNASGVTFKNKLDQNQTVNITLNRDFSTIPQPDGSLDNAVVAHEYTHGISNRLTGTGDGTCLLSATSNEQMGEGWSDYMALMLTMKPTDNSTISRGIGTYVSNEPTSGLGIRPAKYSPDFAINNYTYGKTNGMEVPATLFGVTIGTSPDVHSIGFVWATMLWDLTWDYVTKYGFNSDVTADPNSGNARILQTVMDGMKLQPCNPTFIQGRDAIIAADQAKTGGTNKCMIWKTFAKRGLGINASPGGINGTFYDNTGAKNPDLYDQVEDFDVPTECKLATSETSFTANVSVYPSPAKNEIFINSKNTTGSLQVKIYNMAGQIVLDTKYNTDSKQPINISNLLNGVYLVKMDGIGVSQTQKIIVKK